MPGRRKTLGTKKVVKKPFYGLTFNWGESYMSLLLGVIVVIVMVLIVVSVARNKKIPGEQNPRPEISATSTTSSEELPSPGQSYTVVRGDTLWSVAEKTYQSGYNWVDIAKANSIEDPNTITAGQKLILPSVDQKVVTQVKLQENQGNANKAEQSLAGSDYTVQKGDYLWKIAEKAYGDGYRWVDIARANNLAQPNIIHSGNVLKIPR